MSVGWKRRWLLALLVGSLVGWWAGADRAWAHVGAPYPVLLEEQMGPYLVSALADPDAGGGTFYVLVEVDGQPPPAGTKATLWVTPDDGHMAELLAPGVWEKTRYGQRFVIEVPFDAVGTWQARLSVDGPAGSGEAAFPVEVTPSGTGWLTTVACLIPFALAAVLWLRGTRRSRSAGTRERLA